MKRDKLKNLIKLSKKSNVMIFNNNHEFRNNDNIINDCNNKKKEKIVTLANLIKELSTDPDNNTLKKIKIINKKYQKEINDLDNLMNNFNNEHKSIDINKNDFKTFDDKNIKKNKKIKMKKILNNHEYIEIYSN